MRSDITNLYSTSNGNNFAVIGNFNNQRNKVIMSEQDSIKNYIDNLRNKCSMKIKT